MRLGKASSLIALGLLAAGGFASVTPVRLGTPVSLENPGHPMSAVVADVTGDGKPDLVALQNRRSFVTIRAGNADGTFGPPTDIATAPGRPEMYATRIRAARLNGDAAWDLVAGRVASTNATALSVLVSDGSGGFTVTAHPQPPTGSLYNVDPFDLADWDGDGDVDVLSAGGSAFFVRRNDGAGNIGAWESIQIDPKLVPGNTDDLLARDIDGDGRVDLVAICLGTVSTVYWRQEDGSVAADDELVLSHGILAAADLDGDGRTDLVSAGSGFIGVFLQDGPRSFAAPGAIPASGSIGFGDVAVADLNGDARPEIVTPVEVFVNTGDGTFGPSLEFAFDPRHAWGVAAGNLDADPLPDLVFAGVFDETRPYPDNSWDGLEVLPVRTSTASVSVASVTPSTLLLGDNVTVDVIGAGFAAGARAELGQGITVNFTAWVAPSLVRANFSVSPGVAQGPRALTVRNPDGSSASIPVSVTAPRSLDVELRRARLRRNARPDRSSFTGSGSVSFGRLSPDGRFNTGSESAEIRFGDESASLGVQIPPHKGWRVRRNVATWTSPKGRLGPRAKFVVDFKAHSFKFFVDRAEFALAGPDLFFEITLGDETGSSVRTWRPVRRGLAVP